MTPDSGFPLSLLLDGPLFIDELERQPQHFRREHGIESLRLVPAKSAATGVHTIYFKPEHRQWALVRLAKRYRWLFEILLQRGLSGERTLLRQGFSTEDLEFLFDIVPQPPEEYNPIVYDMLWLVATYDEYLTLTEAMAESESFVPEQLLRKTPDVSVDDDGFFTRFLRSHLISRTGDTSGTMHGPGNPSQSETSVTRDATYEVTPEGQDALKGILAEYDRIFGQQEFEPLLINQELDPREHLKEYDPGPAEPDPDVSFDEMRDDEGILGEIADSFAPLDEDLGSPNTQAESTSAEPESVQEPSDSTRVTIPGDQTDESMTTPTAGAEPAPERSQGPQPAQVSSPAEEANHDQVDGTPKDEFEEQLSEETFVGEYTRDEVLDAAVAAARVINEHSLARTETVKSAVWEAVDVGDRSQTVLWEAVRDILIEMDCTHGRGGGHIWTAGKYTGE